MSESITTEVKPLKHAEDLELVGRALEGETVAVRQFQDTYRPLLARVLMSRGVGRVDAEDLVADIFAECFGAGKNGRTRPLLSKFEGRSSLSTWMIRTTWNRWLDLKRRDKFRGELPSYEDDDERGADPFERIAGTDPGEDLLDRDLAEMMGRAIREAFDSLEPEILLMLKLSHLHGVSQSAIARMWRIDQTRVSRTLSRAREQVAKATMQKLREADGSIELEWEDFQKLCAAGLDL